MKYDNIIDTTLIAIGTALGISQIESILGIIIISIQILWILFKLCYNVYKSIKDKKYEKVKQEVDKAIDELENLKKEGGD
nr:MAG TPA: ATP synthase B chain precursor-like protein [Caudoviricetes sp.]